jgi:hypothetical protein
MISATSQNNGPTFLATPITVTTIDSPLWSAYQINTTSYPWALTAKSLIFYSRIVFLGGGGQSADIQLKATSSSTPTPYNLISWQADSGDASGIIDSQRVLPINTGGNFQYSSSFGRLDTYYIKIIGYY